MQRSGPEVKTHIYKILLYFRSLPVPKTPQAVQLIHILSLSLVGNIKFLHAPLLIFAISSSIIIVFCILYYFVKLILSLSASDKSGIATITIALLVLIVPSLVIKSGFCFNRFAYPSDADVIRSTIISEIDRGHLGKKTTSGAGPFAKTIVQKFDNEDEYFAIYGIYKNDMDDSCCKILKNAKSSYGDYISDVFSQFFIDTYHSIIINYNNNVGYILVNSGQCLGPLK